MKKIILVVLTAFCLLFTTNIAFASLPTLDYFASLIPKPVKTFYDSIQKTDFSLKDAFKDLPKSRTDLVNFLKTIASLFITLLKWAGSIFTWIFNGIANGLEHLITTR